MSLLAATMKEKREEIERHEEHSGVGCCSINQYRDMLSKQLMETEQVCQRFMNLAIRATTSGDQSSDASESKDCVPSGQQELRRDSTRPTREEEQQ